jgi:tetratricopeptide (TPR) repeat protein
LQAGPAEARKQQAGAVVAARRWERDMTPNRTWIAVASLTLASVFMQPVCADGGDGGGGGGGDPATDPTLQPGYQKGIEAINQQRWVAAVSALNNHVRSHWDHADGHNYLAYAYRKSGRLDDAFRHYRRALQIDPRHLGAHEYIGEAYLMAGKPQEAERHLKRLAELCLAQCEEYKDLQRAFTQYRASR